MSKKRSDESFESQFINQNEFESSNRFIKLDRFGTQSQFVKKIQVRAFLNFSRRNSQQTQQFLKKLEIINSITNFETIFVKSIFFNFEQNEIFLKDFLLLTNKFQSLHFSSSFTISFQNNSFVKIDSNRFQRLFRDFFPVSEDLFENKNSYHLKSNDVFNDISKKDKIDSNKNKKKTK